MKTRSLPKFYLNSGIFGGLTVAASALNYALYPILARILNSQNFGDFTVVTSLSNQLLGSLLAINILSIHLLKTLPEDQARSRIESLQKVLLQLFTISVVIVMIVSPLLQQLLHVDNLSSFVFLGLILATAIPSTIWTGYLHGHKKMARIGVYNLGAAMAKIIFTAAFAVLAGSSGAIAGVALSGFVGLLILRSNNRVLELPKLGSIYRKLTRVEISHVRGLAYYLIQGLFVVGVFSTLQNYDIVLAKHLFSPEKAGIYSGVSILSNSLYFLAFLVIWIILPELSLDNKKTNRRVLITGYRLLGLLTVSSVTFVFVFRENITSLLLGDAFSGQGLTLLMAMAYQLLLAAIALYSFYLLTIRSKDSFVLALLVSAITFSTPYLFAESPQSMLKLMVSSLLFAMFVFITYRVILRSLSSRQLDVS